MAAANISVPSIFISAMKPSDWPEAAEIYRQGIASGNATFETQILTWQTWDAAHLPHCRFVARDPDGITGWAALSPASRRAVYAGVAEVSVYVHERARGLGIAGTLMRYLIPDSESHGVWMLQASIFPENDASLRLCNACGFRVVGRRERIARMGSRWRDVLLLERRSSVF